MSLDGVQLRDNQMYLPGACILTEVAIAIDDPARAAVLRAALEPYADRIATSGLAGISVGPVAHYVGLAAEAAGDRRAAIRFQRAAVARASRDGARPYEARAHHALARLLRADGEDDAAIVEQQAAASIAGAIGLVLDA